jgi:hypothetical protein
MFRLNMDLRVLFALSTATARLSGGGKPIGKRPVGKNHELHAIAGGDLLLLLSSNQNHHRRGFWGAGTDLIGAGDRRRDFGAVSWGAIDDLCRGIRVVRGIRKRHLRNRRMDVLKRARPLSAARMDHPWSYGILQSSTVRPNDFYLLPNWGAILPASRPARLDTRADRAASRNIVYGRAADVTSTRAHNRFGFQRRSLHSCGLRGCTVNGRL